jgi:hypothetical protein
MARVWYTSHELRDETEGMSVLYQALFLEISGTEREHI